MNRRRMLTAVVVAVAVGSIVAACAPTKAPPSLPDGLHPPDSPPPPNSPALTTDTGFVTGLSHPWDMAFLPLPDSTMFFTERTGTVKARFADGITTDVVTLSDVAHIDGASGLMGIAVNGTDMFVCYTSPSDNRVVRYPYAINASTHTVLVVEATGVPIVTGISNNPDHHGCRVRIGPDGKLWVTTGDARTGGLPQDLGSLNGKVLRVNLDGSVPGDNPFADSLVYTRGHRNPQGIAFQPGNGQPYSIEHGSWRNDEVNKLVPGGNGCWNALPNDDEALMNDPTYAPCMEPIWRSGDSFTVAPSGAGFLTGTQWKSWNGALVVAFLKDSKARVMFLDGNGNVSSATPILSNGVRLRSAVEGPDGNLYISTDVGDGGGAIWKVTPT